MTVLLGFGDYARYKSTFHLLTYYCEMFGVVML